MNERIKLLAEQAEREVYPVTCLYKDEGAPRLNAQFEQKFAELIVRECMEIVGSADMTELEGPDPEDVLYVACKQVKEHFGVEE